MLFAGITNDVWKKTKKMADLQGFDGGRSPNEREHRSPQGEKRKATTNKESTPIVRWGCEAQREMKNAVKTDVLKQRVFVCRKVDSDMNLSNGGGRWIRTTESDASRFTVCPL